MPRKLYTRDQDWLLPPSLGELVAVDHPVRFVAELVDMLNIGEMGIVAEPAEEGAPSFDPRLLLAVWMYGFMARVRSTRKLQRACRENVCFMWLAGTQKPDHVTLWRFYDRNRASMRKLLKRTVQLAVEVGLVDFALQAIDGSRIGSASRESLKRREAVERLLVETETQIAAMEASVQREEEEDEPSVARSKGVRSREEVRERLRRALSELDRMEGKEPDPQAGVEREHSRRAEPTVSVSDPDAVVLRGRQGHIVGYNAQAVVDSRAQIIVAADVAPCTSDARQLVPMLEEAQQMTGREAAVIVADGGYHSASNVAVMEKRPVEFFAPDPQLRRKSDAPGKWAFHKDNFTYDASRDVLICPQGQILVFSHTLHRNHGRVKESRVYRCGSCRQCPAWGKGGCTQDKLGRCVTLFGHEEILQKHRSKMDSELAKQVSKRRKAIVEPVFAMIKEQLGCTRFLVRGLAKVLAEWHLTCSAYNLLKIWRLWWRPRALALAG